MSQSFLDQSENLSSSEDATEVTQEESTEETKLYLTLNGLVRALRDASSRNSSDFVKLLALVLMVSLAMTKMNQ